MRFERVHQHITCFIVLFPCLFATPLWAQKMEEAKGEYLMEQSLEGIIEGNENFDFDFHPTLETWSYLKNNPLNLNAATKEELQAILFLNDFQINNLIYHIQSHGSLLSMEELQSVEGFSEDLIRLLKRYAITEPPISNAFVSIKKAVYGGRNQLVLRSGSVLEKQAAYFSNVLDTIGGGGSRYYGDNKRILFRYKYTNANKLSCGLSAEKDPGEEFFRGSQVKGFDFYSAHLFFRNLGQLKALGIGDYQCQFGQGLVFATGIGFGKSSNSLNVKRNAVGLRPYTAMDENEFLRGLGTTISIKGFEITAFFSNKNRDGIKSHGLDSDSTGATALSEKTYLIESFQASGLHRTALEMQRKNTIQEMIYGSHLAYKKGNLNLGATMVKIEYPFGFLHQEEPYKRFDQTLRSNRKLGMDYNYLYRNIGFFGEWASDNNQGFASINGAVLSLDPKLSISLVHRNYQKNYLALYSKSFGESTSNRNEKGIYAGILIEPQKEISISAYCDQYYFSWLKYQINAPSSGRDYLVQLNYNPFKSLEMYGRVRMRSKQKNNMEHAKSLDYLEAHHYKNYRFNVVYSLSSSLKFKNRVELLLFQIDQNKAESGFLITQDIVYKKINCPYSFSLRYALFDTDSYASRIYIYENDVPYSYSLPAYYYKGTRAYFSIGYSILKNVDVWVRYAQSVYTDRSFIGSGDEKIEGNKKSELKIQLRLEF